MWLPSLIYVLTAVVILLSSAARSGFFLHAFRLGFFSRNRYGSTRKWLGCADLSLPFAASIGAWTEAGLTELCSNLSNDLQSRSEQEDIPLRHSAQTCPFPSGCSSEEANTSYAKEATLAMCDEQERGWFLSPVEEMNVLNKLQRCCRLHPALPDIVSPPFIARAH